LRDVCCCTNSDRELEDTEDNCKAPPITIGAFGVSGFYPLLVNFVDAIPSQHAKKSSPITEMSEPSSIHLWTERNKKNEDEKSVGKAQSGA
jgi:hypothetical protein